MLPLAKATVLAVLLGGGTVGAYALTGGFGSGSGNGNETTAQEGTSENNALPSQPAVADTPQDAPRGSEGTDGVDSVRALGGAGADTTQQLNAQEQGQEEQGNPGSNESDPNPKGDGVTQNVSGKDKNSEGETAVAGGEEAEVTLGEEKTSVPNGDDSADHSA